MASNSKLTPLQKMDLKDLKFAAKAQDIQLAHNGQTTVAYQNKGNTVELALSVTSPDETKFRRKVGEFHALERFFDNQTVKMAAGDFDFMYHNCALESKADRKQAEAFN
jgi:hypothetical protein